jgi:hypothetical protein
MKQFVLLLFLLEFNELLLKHILQIANQLLIVLLNLADLDLRSLQNIVFDFISVALHGQSQPLLEADLHGSRLVVFLTTLLHSTQIFVFVCVLLPSVEESALVVFGVEKCSEVFDFVAFLLHLNGLKSTLRLRMQYASNSFRLWLYRLS